MYASIFLVVSSLHVFQQNIVWISHLSHAYYMLQPSYLKTRISLTLNLSAHKSSIDNISTTNESWKLCFCPCINFNKYYYFCQPFSAWRIQVKIVAKHGATSWANDMNRSAILSCSRGSYSAYRMKLTRGHIVTKPSSYDANNPLLINCCS